MRLVSNDDVRDDGGKYYSSDQQEILSQDATNKGLEIVDLNKQLETFRGKFRIIDDLEPKLARVIAVCNDISKLVGYNIEPRLKEIKNICTPYNIPGYKEILDFSNIIGESSILKQTYDSCEDYISLLSKMCKGMDPAKRKLADHIYNTKVQIEDAESSYRYLLTQSRLCKEQDNK